MQAFELEILSTVLHDEQSLIKEMEMLGRRSWDAGKYSPTIEPPLHALRAANPHSISPWCGLLSCLCHPAQCGRTQALFTSRPHLGWLLKDMERNEVEGHVKDGPWGKVLPKRPCIPPAMQIKLLDWMMEMLNTSNCPVKAFATPSNLIHLRQIYGYTGWCSEWAATCTSDWSNLSFHWMQKGRDTCHQVRNICLFVQWCIVSCRHARNGVRLLKAVDWRISLHITVNPWKNIYIVWYVQLRSPNFQPLV